MSWAIKALGSPCQQLTHDMLIILGKPKQEPGARKARSVLKKCGHLLALPILPTGLRDGTNTHGACFNGQCCISVLTCEEKFSPSWDFAHPQFYKMKVFIDDLNSIKGTSSCLILTRKKIIWLLRNDSIGIHLAMTVEVKMIHTHSVQYFFTPSFTSGQDYQA